HALAVLVVEGELGGEDADLREPFAKAERGELAHRIGLQVDAVTDRLELGHLIVDAAGDAGPVPAERQRQSGKAAADGDDVHLMTCFSIPSPTARSVCHSGTAPKGPGPESITTGLGLWIPGSRAEARAPE